MNARLLLLSLVLLSPFAALGTSSNPSTVRPQIDLEEKEGERAQRPVEQAPSSVPNPIPQSYAIGDIRAFQVAQPQAVAQSKPVIEKDEKAPESVEDNNDDFFIAFDRGDVAICRRLIDAKKADINARDQRELLPVLSKYPKDIEQGFTPLMKAAATGVEELAEFCLEKNADFLATTNICLWMATENAKIRLWDFFDCLEDLAQPQRSETREYLFHKHGDEGNLREILEDPDIRRHTIFSFLTDHLDALSLAVIAGHVEIVDLLLKKMIAGLEQEGVSQLMLQASVKDAIVILVRISNLVKTTIADDLFATIGIKHRAYSNYPIILTKLIEAYRTIDSDKSLDKELRAAWQKLVAASDLHDARYTSRYGKWTVLDDLDSMFQVALKHGSIEILPAIAKALADTPSGEESSFGATAFIQNHNSGEKLAILLAINAAPNSITSHIRDEIFQNLERIPHYNPTFVQRLQNFVREQHGIKRQMDNALDIHLPPVLASIVQGYAAQYPLPPRELIQRILTVGPQRQQIIDGISHLRTVVRIQEEDHVAEQLTKALDLLKLQPFTTDVLSLAREQLTDINQPNFSGPKALIIQMIGNEIRRQQELIQPYR